MLEIETVQVFGPTKGRSGYSFANVHDNKVLNRVLKEKGYQDYSQHCLNYFKLLNSQIVGLYLDWPKIGPPNDYEEIFK